MIPVSRPDLGGRELEYVTDCITGGWVGGGEYVGRLERLWADACQRQHAVATCNGSSALQLAVMALGLPPGSEVIIPSMTIISCATAVLSNGLKPVIVDVDPHTWCISPDRVREAMTDRTSAIMAVHMFGQPCDMDDLEDLAAQTGIHLIEDAAQAHGASVRLRACGSYGTVSCFSFYANKNVACGEGGMALCGDGRIADRLRAMGNLYLGKGVDRFKHAGLGYNFRMSNLQAAVAMAQAERLRQVNARKAAIYERYRSRLAGRKDLLWQHRYEGSVSSHWVTPVVLAKGRDAATIIRRLAVEGVDSRPFFHPLGLQAPLMPFVRALPCPASARLAASGLYLPSGAGTTDDEVDMSCDALIRVLDA